MGKLTFTFIDSSSKFRINEIDNYSKSIPCNYSNSSSRSYIVEN